MGRKYVNDSAEVDADQVSDVVAQTLKQARETCGEEIGALSVELRLWAAAALIDSCLRVGRREQINAAIELKLGFLKGLWDD